MCEPALSQVAGQLNLGQYLLLGKGEEKSGAETVPLSWLMQWKQLLARYTLIRAMQLLAILSWLIWKKQFRKSEAGDHYDYKSRLQELVQGKSRDNVSYSILEETGPAHDRSFVAGVFYQDRLLATGTGHSKRKPNKMPPVKY